NISKRSGRAPHCVAHVRARLHGKTDIFLDTQSNEQIGDLKRTADTSSRDVLRLKSSDRRSLKLDRTGIRRVKAGQHIECRRLAGSIWPDQGVQCLVAHREVEAAYGMDAAEALLQISCRKGQAVIFVRAQQASR